MSEQLTFSPPKSVQGFLTSSSFISLIVGPVGSTKTSAGIMKIAYMAKQMAPCKDGVRRSRCVWIRNTNQMLHDTSIPDFLKWFPDGQAGTLEKVKMRFVLQFDDVSCEVLFRGLEDQNDVRRLLSLQISFAVMDEFREINQQIFEAVQGRLGRYPDKSMVPPRPEWGNDDKGLPIGGCVKDDGTPNKHIWGMTNPPDLDTFWETFLTSPPTNASVFFQPSGLSQEADWLQYLPSDYYENLAEGKSQDWIDVYINAQFGKSLAGRPVFSSFKQDLHVAKQPLIIQSSPLIIGVDAGLTPTATICQLDYQGRLLVHDSISGESMGALRFIREMLKPLLTNKYGNKPCSVIIDPAAFQRAQTDERTVADMFKNEGFQVKPARTNTITARIAAVDNFLTRTVDGKQAILFDPGCKGLIMAMRSKYRYKTNTKGETDDSPEKSHPWSDYCFVAGTLVATPTGPTPIETLRVGDAVCTHDGVDFVSAVGSRESELVTLGLSDGSSLTCTPDHPFVLKDSHIVSADTLQYADVLATIEDGVWASGQWRTQPSGRLFVRAYSAVVSLKLRLGGRLKAKAGIVPKPVTVKDQEFNKESSTTGYGSVKQPGTHITGTSGATNALSLCIDMFGSTTTDPSLTGTISTMLMGTQRTTTTETYSACRTETTNEGTFLSATATEGCTCPTKPEAPQRSGTDQKPDASGIERTRQSLQPKPCTPAPCVGPATSELSESTSGITAPLRVTKSSYVGSGVVYNLTTNRTHMYYAGGVLVHNCDSLQYAALHADNGNVYGANHTSKAREVKKVAYIY